MGCFLLDSPALHWDIPRCCLFGVQAKYFESVVFRSAKLIMNHQLFSKTTFQPAFQLLGSITYSLIPVCTPPNVHVCVCACVRMYVCVCVNHCMGNILAECSYGSFTMVALIAESTVPCSSSSSSSSSFSPSWGRKTNPLSNVAQTMKVNPVVLFNRCHHLTSADVINQPFYGTCEERGN